MLLTDQGKGCLLYIGGLNSPVTHTPMSDDKKGGLADNFADGFLQGMRDAKTEKEHKKDEKKEDKHD